MTTSRLARLGVPIGIGGAVLALTVATVAQRGGDGRPARLPIGLQSGGDARAAAGEAAGAPGTADLPYYGGNVSYRFAAGTLEGLANEGRAYRLSGGRADRGDVERLASALGISGEPTRTDGAWVAREGHRELRVADDPGNPWYLSPYAHTGCGSVGGSTGEPEPDAPPPPPDGAEPAIAPAPAPAPGSDARCVKPAEPAEPADRPTSDTDPDGTPAPPPDKGVAVCEAPPPPESGATTTPCSEDPGAGGGSSGSTGTVRGGGVACGCPEGAKCACPEPSPVALGPESQARAKAEAVLRASGHDDLTLRVERGYDAWYITGDLEVGGMRTLGFGVHIGIDATGDVRDANGWLGSADAADTYPLLDPAEAAKRNPWGGGIRPMIGCDALTPECQQPKDVVREVTAVELGLLFTPVLGSDRSDAYLVPAWLLTLADQRDYPETVLALPDEYLQEPESPDGECDAKGGCDSPVSDGGETVVEPARPAEDQPRPASGAPEPARS